MSVSELFANGKRPNILIIITDQERAIQHWPESFSRDHLPSMERLKKHGLDFKHHYTNTCMCSPSRSTLLTSQFPIKTGVTRTGSPGPPRALPTDIPNMATMFKKAGYPRVEWHGKWHVGKTPSDYGFEGWQPPDAGNYLAVNDTLGGGTPDNDGRFLKDLCNTLEQYHDDNQRKGNNEGQNEPEPFCIVASFVNPHDVYVAQHGPAKGYTRADYKKIEVPLPPNLMEDPDKNNKPRSQAQMSMRYVEFKSSHQEYVNFYAHLHTVVDAQIGKLLDQLDRLGFTDSTLILRTADHGEQGLSHSLVEKFYNCYQESLHIPLVVSNPIAFPEPQTTDALSSHLDIVPTLAGLLCHKKLESYKGKDLTPVLENPQMTTTIAGKNETQDTIVGVQSRIHFTYDDIPCPGAPSKIRCVHKGHMKYAVYFEPLGRDADWELYDLTVDPLENTNLAGNPEYDQTQKEMEKELYEVMVEMETLPKEFQWPPKATPHSKGFNHPQREEIEESVNEDHNDGKEEKSTLGSYTFSDEGELVRIFLNVQDVRAKCSEKDIELKSRERSLSLIVKNYQSEDFMLSFKKLTSEITHARHEIEENRIVLILTKKDHTVKWNSVLFKDPGIEALLQDPIIQQIMRDFHENPVAANRAMSNPQTREKILQLVHAGVLKVV